VNARRSAAWLLAAVLALGVAAPSDAAAASADTVVLRNGDRLTGEVKNLDKGRLEFSTLAMSTIYIEWDKVVGLTAAGAFEVETVDGGRYIGQPVAGAAGKLGLALEEGRTVQFDFLSVVRMRRIKDVWWRRLSGGINLGASYTQSSGVGQGTLTSNVTFRRPAFEVSSAFDQTLSLDHKQVTSSRTSFRSNYTRLLPHRWFLPGLLNFDRNRELGYDLRATVGGGVGRFLAQSNKGSLGVGGGLVYNRELPVDGDSSNSIEAFFGVTGSFYRYDTPKTNLTLSAAGYPSLSDAGRFRFDLNTSLTYELVKDFTIGFTLYNSYDNRPPTAGTLKNDVGTSLTLGWTF
jgi:putative salt-induced outer membrane protein YdiY